MIGDALLWATRPHMLSKDLHPISMQKVEINI